MPASVIKFEGLMVFRRDRRRGGCEVGILPVKNVEDYPDHEFKITVTPHPDPGANKNKLEIKGAEMERFRAAGGAWRLDVVNSRTGQCREGIVMNPEPPEDRHDPNGDLQEFGWIMDVESYEFHDRPMPRLVPGRLNPIIYLSSGRLYTFNKTDGIDVWQGEGSTSPKHFGFIAETLALSVDMEPGDEIVLRADGADLSYHLPYREGVNYQVTIENSEPMAHADMGDKMYDHFQLYYELLFPEVPCHERFRLKLTEPSEPSPNPCTSIMHNDGGAEAEEEIRTVYPYKCGGIYLSLTDAPLS